MRLRLIPLVIFTAALFFTVRVGGIYVDVGDAIAETAGKPIDLTSGMNAASDKPADKAKAETAKPDAAAKPAAAKTPPKAEPPKTEPSKTATAKTEPAKPAAPEQPAAAKPAAERPAAVATAKPAEAIPPPPKAAEAPTAKPAETPAAATKSAAGEPPAESARAAPEKTPGMATVDATPPRPILPRPPVKDEALPDPDDMSRGDLKILQELAQRRRELDQREQDLAMRDGLLKAAEKRVDEKIAELAKMKAQLETLVKQREDQQTVQLKSLVKIYENMKPKDAAQIFDQLDMTILVELLAHMKEAKSAPVMAAMDPKRVKDVTARLINRRTLGPAAAADGAKTVAR